jgi:putative transposase
VSAPALLLSSGDLAALRIDGLPSNARAIRRLIPEAGWQTSPGARGSVLIDVNSLSPDQAQAVRDRLASRLSVPVAEPQAVRRVGRPAGTNFFTRHPEIAQAVTAYLAVHRFAAPNVYEFLRDQGMSPLPEIHTLRRFIRRVENEQAVILTALRDPDAAKSKHRLALGRADGGSTYAHEVWELDTTKADVMIAGGRVMILGVIDRWSRRARFIVAPSESAQSVRSLLIRAILDWGVVPGTIVVDNGSGYINATVLTACEMLGIEHKPCPPGSPERKPFVERMFGTFSRQRLVIADGFTGHNVAQAQQLRARARKETGRAEILAKISAEELQDMLDNWVIGVYEARIHSGIGMSPLAKAMRSPIPARAAPPEDEVRRAMTAFVGNQTITKRGLRWKSGRYWCAELAAYLGRPVHVRRNEDDLGALLVFDEAGAFIGTAVNYEREGLSEQAFAIAARSHQKAYEKLAKAEIREAMKNYPIERARTAVFREDAVRAGKLVTLPAPVAQPEVAAPRPQAPAKIYKLPTAASTRGNVVALVERAEALLARETEGHDVDANDLAWAREFTKGAAYAAFKAEAAFEAGNKPVIITTRRKP